MPKLINYHKRCDDIKVVRENSRKNREIIIINDYLN